MLELILARHGQSHGNLDFALGPDTDLTDLGRRQAAQLGRWLAEQGYTFTACYCSTLRRARQTAALINTHYDLDIVFDPDLREAEVWLPGELPRRDGPLSAPPSPPFSAAYEAMHERVRRATARILANNLAGQVLVVAHGGTLGTMIRSILGSHALLLHTDLAAVHSLSWKDGLWNLGFVNRQEHLAIATTPPPP
jgi:broad specificity phosphatase PhoE